MTDSLSLHRKLSEIYAVVERIPKNGTAPAEMGGFKFVQVGDAADPIRHELAQRRLTMLPTVVEVVGQTEHDAGKNAKGVTITTTTIDLRVTWTITDGDTGESMTIQSMGSGADRGDKYTPKAMTASMKYALLTGFLMPTGDDPEISNSEERGSHSRTVRPTALASSAAIEPQSNGSIYGVVQVKPEWLSDLEMRSTPTGAVIGFRLKDGRRSIKVQAHGALAIALAAVRAEMVDQTVTCWGEMATSEFTPKGTTRPVSYPILLLKRIKGPFGEFPSPGVLVEPAADPVVTGDVDYDDDKLWEKVPEVGAPAA
jgi:hypothetical protein